jgi:hypothetical protein
MGRPLVAAGHMFPQLTPSKLFSAMWTEAQDARASSLTAGNAAMGRLDPSIRKQMFAVRTVLGAWPGSFSCISVFALPH